MRQITNVDEVFGLIQQVKAGGPAFCTNFFPVRKKVEGWVQRGELLADERDGAAFFLRSDGDFQRLYFCAAGLPPLEQEIGSLPSLKSGAVVLDLVGNEASLREMLGVFESAGFRSYRRLERLARAGHGVCETTGAEAPAVVIADRADLDAIADLLRRSFDKYADQLPTISELEDAIGERQIALVKCDGAIAALLFSETQGLTSTIRYWVVAEQFRSRRFGSALMRHYFAAQSSVRRFVLWVVGSNADAVRKYRHFGYAPDGLVDHVMANGMVPA
jgi:ribosomal protein S18 acetylase RimI-like enzyme